MKAVFRGLLGAFLLALQAFLLQNGAYATEAGESNCGPGAELFYSLQISDLPVGKVKCISRFFYDDIPEKKSDHYVINEDDMNFIYNEFRKGSYGFLWQEYDRCVASKSFIYLRGRGQNEVIYGMHLENHQDQISIYLSKNMQISGGCKYDYNISEMHVNKKYYKTLYLFSDMKESSIYLEGLSDIIFYKGSGGKQVGRIFNDILITSKGCINSGNNNCNPLYEKIFSKTFLALESKVREMSEKPRYGWRNSNRYVFGVYDTGSMDFVSEARCRDAEIRKFAIAAMSWNLYLNNKYIYEFIGRKRNPENIPELNILSGMANRVDVWNNCLKKYYHEDIKSMGPGFPCCNYTHDIVRETIPDLIEYLDSHCDLLTDGFRTRNNLCSGDRPGTVKP